MSLSHELSSVAFSIGRCMAFALPKTSVLESWPPGRTQSFCWTQLKCGLRGSIMPKTPSSIAWEVLKIKFSLPETKGEGLIRQPSQTPGALSPGTQLCVPLSLTSHFSTVKFRHYLSASCCRSLSNSLPFFPFCLLNTWLPLGDFRCTK